MTTNKIRIQFTEISNTHSFFACPMSDIILADYYHRQGYKATLNGNMITINTTYGTQIQYVITLDVDSLNDVYSTTHSNSNNRRYNIVNNIANLLALKVVREINAGF